MGCCQTRDSNEIQLYTPREQSQNQQQVTFGAIKSVNTKNSFKSNYNSNYQRNTLNNGSINKESNSNANKKQEENQIGTPLNLSFGNLKEDDIKMNDATSSNLSFVVPRGVEEQKYCKEEEKDFEEESKSKVKEEDKFLNKRDKFFERIDKLQPKDHNRHNGDTSSLSYDNSRGNRIPSLKQDKNADSGYKSGNNLNTYFQYYHHLFNYYYFNRPRKKIKPSGY